MLRWRLSLRIPKFRSLDDVSPLIDDLVICGTLANVCVLHTAGSAGLRDFRPVLIDDAIGYIEEDHHEYALDHADWLFGEVRERTDITFG